MKYKNDPRLIKARFGNCSICGRKVEVGEEVLYFPKSYTVQCRKNEACERDNQKVLTAIADEDFFINRSL